MTLSIFPGIIRREKTIKLVFNSKKIKIPRHFIYNIWKNINQKTSTYKTVIIKL